MLSSRGSRGGILPTTTTGTRKTQREAIEFTFASVWSISSVANTTIDIFHHIDHINIFKVVWRVTTSRRLPSNNLPTRGKGNPTIRIRYRTRELQRGRVHRTYSHPTTCYKSSTAITFRARLTQQTSEFYFYCPATLTTITEKQEDVSGNERCLGDGGERCDERCPRCGCRFKNKSYRETITATITTGV